MKILIYNKMRTKGMNYEEAVKEVETEVNQVRENSRKVKNE